MDDIHIIPKSDFGVHDENHDCPCHPIFKDGGWDGANLYYHNSFEEMIKRYEGALLEIANQCGCEGWNHEQAIKIARKALNWAKGDE